MGLNLDRLNGLASDTQNAKTEQFRFEISSNSFLVVRVLNDVLRRLEPGSIGLTWSGSNNLPEPLSASSRQLVLEKTSPGEPFDLVIRDGKSGFAFFNIEGHIYDYDPVAHSLSINCGRLLISEELAAKLGRPADAGMSVGDVALTSSMYPIEVATLVNGAVKSSVMPSQKSRSANSPEGGGVPGPDIIVGSMQSLMEYGSAAGQVGLGIGTTSCNNGDQPVHFYQLPNQDHSVVTQNLYRMSGGATNDQRFEQIGGAWVKHTFGASQDDECSFGCNPFPDDSELGVGCSDTYLSSQNASQTDHVGALGSRAWVNPFTGFFPSNPEPESHAGHVHSPTSHRILVNTSDLNTTLNTGATYYAEVMYDSPHEYAWCQSHPGQCNMYNNASYRRYNVAGTTSFSFAAVGSTVRMTPATGAWTGATSSTIEPAPGADGRAFIVYKVSGPVGGLYHYEYGIHNQNLDRSIQSFSVPLGCGANVTNIEFHAPPNHPGFPNDGTAGNAGFSNAPWTSSETPNALSWATETVGQNPNANAIRFGTMYNFRFDSDQPPQAANAVVGFFKTGEPITVPIQAPCGGTGPTPTATATGTPTETGTPSPSPSTTPGGTPTPTVTPTPGPVQALNLSTRLRVETADNVGIGGFIVTGSDPKQVLLRAIGPSLGVTDPLADPEMELHGPSGFETLTNDNWQDTQGPAIQATGLAPTNDLESAILVTLNPGAYTAIVKGKNNGTGIGLVEIYDLGSGANSKLANISTRAFVQTGNDIMIAGFILGGNILSDNVVIRGIGPSLGGVSNPLADPKLELRDGNGGLIVMNNNCGDDPVQAAVVAAAGLTPSNASEACIAATLGAGPFTALLYGADGGTGIGLVEMYDIGPGAIIPTPTPGATTPPTSPTPTATVGGTPTPPPPSPTPSAGPPCTENFDSVTAPALPPGWVASNPDPGDGTMWATATTNPASPPNSLFLADQDGISDKVVDRVVSITSASPVMSFRNNFNTEFSDNTYWDGYVLEVSSPNISNGDFLDITDSHVGGSFVSGGYTGLISSKASNPLSGRMAWSSDSGGYIDTVINMGPNLVGQTVTLRFRMGTDEAVAAPGVWVDNISIQGGSCP